MILEITINDQTTTYNLTELGARYSGVVTLGKHVKEVWNAIRLDDESVDPFQCHLLGSGESWTLKHGQHRTECPKGLVSDKIVPCNGCMGRCVNVRPGRPKYYERTPQIPTNINGKPVAVYGSDIKVGDVITIGAIEIKVVSDSHVAI